MVVGRQVPLISVRLVGAPNVAGVVNREPCGLLHKMKTGCSGLRRILRGRGGCGTLTLFPTDSLPSRATFVCCIRWGGW